MSLDSFEITKILGLHAREAVQVAKIVEKAQAKAVISTQDGKSADCSSVLGMLLLGASTGSLVKIDVQETKGDENQLKQEIKKLLGS